MNDQQYPGDPTALIGPTLRHDAETGSWVAFNDLLRVVAGGGSRDDAIANYETALRGLLDYEAKHRLAPARSAAEARAFAAAKSACSVWTDPSEV
jgi:predicted RNase H-like HicB family nuclease